MRLIDADAVKQKYRDRLVKSLVDKDRGIDLSEHAEKLSKSFNRFIDKIADDDDVLEQIRAEIAELPEDMGTITSIKSGEIIGKYISSIKVLQIIDKYKEKE